MLLFTATVGGAQPDSITSISANTALTLRLDGKQAALLAYNATEPQVITLTVQAVGELDPVVEMLTPDGQRLAYNDDYPSDLLRTRELAPTDAALIRLSLPDAGRYLIRVNSFNGVSEGEVEVSLNVVDLFSTEISTQDDLTTITLDLPADGVYIYPLEGKAGEKLILTSRDPAGVLDSVLILHDVSGAVIAANDDHNSDDFSLNIFDARISDVTLPADSTYTLELHEFTGRAGILVIEIKPAR